MITITFQAGTLLITNLDKSIELIKPYIQYDQRIKQWRAQAIQYSNIILTLHHAKIKYQDNAKNFQPLHLTHKTNLHPRPHQQAAFQAWLKGGGRGVIVMPTGSGKSFLARMIIEKINRPTLIIVPTIDLMQQWASQLEQTFNIPIGMLGGGSKDLQNITISTYDSAVLQMEFIGNQFGLLIFDECHHLPTTTNRHAATFSIAPYRLGLTATPERNDNGEHLLYQLLGSLQYRIHIDQLEKNILSPYHIERLELELDSNETKEYQKQRQIYLDFIKANYINFSTTGAWGRFIVCCFTKEGGREAFNAYQKQKNIARTSRAKLNTLWKLIQKHRGERIIVFTADNQTAYTLGKRFLLPVITHHTKATERKNMLDNFRSGKYNILITSKVLNEGIDVPEASVGIIISGSGSTREHVQRLGRILRPAKNKQAQLYELVSAGTSETYTSERRRQHRAYQRFN